MTVLGGDRVQLKFRKLKKLVKKYGDASNKKNGDDVVRIAKVLVPNKSGDARSEIIITQLLDGSVLCDFGSKSKVIEGNRGPRPFVNPALKVSRKRRKGRNKRAINKAVKEAFNG